MDRRSLRHFLSIYEVGTMRGAADRANITQPALSKSLRQLEEELELKLFERRAEGMVPTAAGRTLAHHAERIELRFRRASDDLASFNGKKPPGFTVATAPSVMSTIVPELTHSLEEQHPTVRFVFHGGVKEMWQAMLLKGQADLVLASPTRDENIPLVDKKRIFRDELCIVASADHPLAQSEDLESLRHARWVAPLRGEQTVRGALRAVFENYGLDAPPTLLESSSEEHMRKMVVEGGYLTYAPRLLFRRDEKAGRSTVLGIAGSREARDVCLLRRRTAQPSSIVKDLENTVKKIASDLGMPTLAD